MIQKENNCTEKWAKRKWIISLMSKMEASINFVSKTRMEKSWRQKLVSKQENGQKTEALKLQKST